MLYTQAGLHDEWKKSELKVFCPKCRDLYTPVVDYQAPASALNARCCVVSLVLVCMWLADLCFCADFDDTIAVDGAYFGTTFPHLFFMTYRELEPAPSTLLYVPRVFGYKIHNKHENRRRLAILAHEDDDEHKATQQQQVCRVVACAMPCARAWVR